MTVGTPPVSREHRGRIYRGRLGARDPDQLPAARTCERQAQISDECHIASRAELGAGRADAAIAQFDRGHSEEAAGLRIGYRLGSTCVRGKAADPLRLRVPLKQTVKEVGDRAARHKRTA
jgi:hypothetical protein